MLRKSLFILFVTALNGLDKVEMRISAQEPDLTLIRHVLSLPPPSRWQQRREMSMEEALDIARKI